MTLTRDQINQLSQGRLVVFKHGLSDDEVRKLAEALGILPPTPNPTNNGVRKTIRTKWQGKLTPIQRTAWATLTPHMKKEYFAKGRVTLGQRPLELGALAQHPLEIADQPSGSARREDLWELSRKRLFVFDAKLSEDELRELAQTLRRLPHRPPRTRWTRDSRKIRELWKKKMTETQSEAWASLNNNYKSQYLATGHVQLGRPPSGEKSVLPVGSATTEEIIKAVERQADEQDWDINKIDWGST